VSSCCVGRAAEAVRGDMVGKIEKMLSEAELDVETPKEVAAEDAE